MTANTEWRGGCLCGAVRYVARGTPRHACHCHCTMCRKAAGAPMVTWVSFPTEGFEVTAGEARWYRSSELARRGFCGDCGSTLFFQFAATPEEIDITATTLDEPERITPEAHIWATTRLPWLHLDDGLPRYREDSGSERL